jgi:cytochrome P450
MSFTHAAAETVGHAMACAVHHVLDDPEVYKRLREELVEAFPDESKDLGMLELEKLPYLTAVIKEGLRYAILTIQRWYFEMKC